ncbi:septal ring lytic transglycosylase RlpA family protein [Rapidithrix thailandica]|uniref:Probable endolytic peptidoglycan transglycosylase RlpA n=1 Tax=Rapidithrix thailandica TaxID=413964 RepID=A0AAW9RWW2_9BACT
MGHLGKIYVIASLLLFTHVTWAQNTYKAKGKAAFYADRLHGRPTASGEPYDKNAFTAAHKTLPFGSILSVKNLNNGKQVQVKVNDRGPHTPGRIIDISKAAAIALGMIDQGIADVEITLVDPNANPAYLQPAVEAPAEQNNYAQPASEAPNTVNYSQPAVEAPANNPYTQPAVEQPVVTSPNPVTVTTVAPQNQQPVSQNTVLASVGDQQYGLASYYPDNRNGVMTEAGNAYDMNQLLASHATAPINSLVRVEDKATGNTVVVHIVDRPDTKYIIKEGTVILLSKAAAEKIGMAGKLSIQANLEIVALDWQKPQAQTLQVQAKAAPTAFKAAEEFPEATILIETQEEKVEEPNIPEQVEAASVSTPVIVYPEMSVEELTQVFLPPHTYTLEGQKVKPVGYGVQVHVFSNIKSAFQKALHYQQIQFNHVYLQAGWQNKQKVYRILLGSFHSEEEAKPLLQFIQQSGIKAFVKKHYDLSK